jgi:glycosyltransferase involved in cell wall biosynthesis
VPLESQRQITVLPEIIYLRIAIANWTRRRVGGIEAYLNGLIPQLSRFGHQLAFLSAEDIPASRDQIELSPQTPAWCASESGVQSSLERLIDWQPDLIFVHKINEPGYEASLLRIAPAVLFAHDYHGTCISGLKTFKNPVVKPCDRNFGWQCLLHYYPHHCGGWSPSTMVKLYRLQSNRFDLLRQYKAIVTLSDHLKGEYIKHGIDPERVFKLPTGRLEAREVAFGDTENLCDGRADQSLRLLFVGRMDQLKGGRMLLDALPRVQKSLGRSLHLTFAGEGPERSAWEKQARHLHTRCAGVKIEFTGWLEEKQLGAVWATADLLVVPSLWPEPFGMVGIEAGLQGVPVAAFAVGGITSWLSDGINGYLAPADPPTASGLAGAIIKCLRDPNVHAQLRRGALERARDFNIDSHGAALNEIFESVAQKESQVTSGLRGPAACIPTTDEAPASSTLAHQWSAQSSETS